MLWSFIEEAIRFRFAFHLISSSQVLLHTDLKPQYHPILFPPKKSQSSESLLNNVYTPRRQEWARLPAIRRLRFITFKRVPRFQFIVQAEFSKRSKSDPCPSFPYSAPFHICFCPWILVGTLRVLQSQWPRLPRARPEILWVQLNLQVYIPQADLPKHRSWRMWILQYNTSLSTVLSWRRMPSDKTQDLKWI